MRELALFPLNTVLFPGVPLHLHIFEPRYRLMIRRCIKENQPFGVVLIRQGMEALGPLATPYEMGCSARIIRQEPLSDGRMNIIVIGDERFKILKLDYTQPYLTATVECAPLENPHALNVLRGTPHLSQFILQYARLLAQIDETVNNVEQITLPGDPLPLLYTAAGMLQLPAYEKQPLLESENASQLLNQVSRLYKREIAMLARMQNVSEEHATLASWNN